MVGDNDELDEFDNHIASKVRDGKNINEIISSMTDNRNAIMKQPSHTNSD